MRFLRQSTLMLQRVGPLLSSGDGFTPVTSVTYSDLTGTIFKDNGSYQQSSAVLTLAAASGAGQNQFVSYGQGNWRLEFTTSNTSALGPFSFTLRSQSNLFVPIFHDFMVVTQEIYDWLFGTTTTILDKLGAATSGANSLYGMLQAIMSMGASLPSGLGTYSPTTDSLEAIRDYLEASIAPQIVAGGSMSGSGFLSRVIGRIRQMTDEPAVEPKYSDSDLLVYFKESMATIISDLSTVTDHPILVRFPITIVDGVQSYTLPANVGQIIAFVKYETTSGLKLWELYTANEKDPTGYGFMVEGQTIRLTTAWNLGETLNVIYAPLAEVAPVKFTSSTYTANTLTLSTVVDGTLDTRENAYAGYLLRILSSTDAGANYVQEVLVTGYDRLTNILTVAANFSPTLAGTMTAELIPLFHLLFEGVSCTHAAWTINSIEGKAKKAKELERVYQTLMRGLRLQMNRMNARRGGAFEGRTSDNNEYINRFLT